MPIASNEGDAFVEQLINIAKLLIVEALLKLILILAFRPCDH